MTDTNDKLRGLFLSALMVMSVFAGAMAFSGGAAAQSGPSISSAVEYGDTIEIVFNDAVVSTGNNANSLSADNFTVEVNGNSETVNSAGAVSAGGAVRYQLDGAWSDINPTDDVTVTVDEAAVSWATGTTATSIEADVDETSTTVNAGGSGTVFYQEQVALGSGAGESFSIENGSTLIRSGSLGDNQTYFAFDTTHEDIQTGKTYTVDWGTSGDATFQVRNLALGASANNVTTSENLTVDVSAKTGGRPIMVELMQDGSVQDTVNVTLSGTSASASADFGEVAAGNYTATATDQQTGVEAETNTINVADAPPDAVQLEGDGVYSEQIGDIVDIPVTFDGGATDGTIVVGSSETNYWIHATLTDDDGDGEVTVQFNSYAAGANNETAVLSAADTDDTVNVVDESGAFTAQTAHAHSATIDATEYNLNVTQQHKTNLGFESDAFGAVSLRPRSTDGLTSMTAPTNASPSEWSASDVQSNIGSTITQDSEIASGDYLVHEVQASGLEGVLAAHDSDATAAFFEAANTSNGNSSLAFTVTQSGDVPNDAPHTLLINESNSVVVADPANDSYYVSTDTDRIYTSRDALSSYFPQDYEANFSVQAGSTIATDSNSVLAEYGLAERSVSIDTQDDLVHVLAESDQELTGSTNVAPGTEFALRIQSQSNVSPFVKRPTASVTGEGSWNATADFSGEDTGTNFTVQIDDQGFSANQDGQIVSELPEGSPGDGTPTEPPTDTPTEGPTPTDGGDMTPSPTEPGTTEPGPGFGPIVALIALIGAALLAIRRNE